MKLSISHDFAEESFEAKAKWFLQKPMEERLQEAFEGLVFFQELCQFELPDDRSIFKTIRVLERKAS